MFTKNKSKVRMNFKTVEPSKIYWGCRAVKFYLVMPHPSPLLKEKELLQSHLDNLLDNNI
jgi:hypothetical protein